MSSNRSRALLLAILTLAALYVSRPVLADERTEARRHFRRGMELVVQGQLDSGIEELELAYQILPHPNVLYNIGRAYAEAGNYEEALDYFARYLDSSPPDADEIRGYVAALEARIANRAMLEAAVSGASTGPSTSSAGPPPADGTRGSADEIADLRATAARLDALGQVMGGTELPARAAALRAVADRMERGNVAAASTPTDTSTSTTTTSSADAATAVTGPDPEAGAQSAIELASANTELYEERFVSSTRAAVDPLDAPNSTTIITRQDIRLTGLTHIGELLRRVAGVHVMTTGPAETNVAIRGFNRRLSPRILLLVNGRSTYVDPLGITIWPQQQFSVEDIERIEVVRGPASALYGANGFSGIVNVITRTPGDEPGVEMDVRGGMGATARVYAGVNGRSGTDGRLGYRMSMAYDQTDRFTQPLDPARVDASIPTNGDTHIGMRNMRVYGNMEYRLTDNVRAYAEGGTTYFTPTAVGGVGIFSDLYLKGTYSTATAGLASHWGGVRFFWNNVTSDVQQWAQRPLPRMEIVWNTYDIEGTFAHEFDTGPLHHNVVAGLGYRRKWVEWDAFDGVHTENHFQGFLQDSLRIGARLTLVAGARVDVHPLLDRPVFSPRGALVGRVGDRQAIRASVSTAFRTPSFLESYLSLINPTPLSAVGAYAGGSEVYHDLFGSTRLRPERILSSELGYQNSESDYVTFDLATYLNRVEDLMELSTDTQLSTIADSLDPRAEQINATAPPSIPYVVGRSGFENAPAVYYVAGLEASGRVYPVDGLDIWANYSLNFTYRDLGNGLDSDQRAPRHLFNVGVQYRHAITEGLGLDVAVDVHTQSKTVWDEQQLVGTALEVVDFDHNAFYMINARVGVRLIEDRLSLGLIGYNLNGFFGPDYRQHPFGQPVAARVLASASYRF